jgi:HSP20 family protein
MSDPEYEEEEMTSLQRSRSGELASPLARLDRMFDEWFRTLPMRRPFGLPGEMAGEEIIRVDEFRDGDTQVVRAELPGIDPEKDVEITVQDGVLHIAAQRRIEEDRQDKGYTRHELRYGSFARTLPVPEGASENDIQASYRDGILEIRIPVVQPPAVKEPTRISVTRS